MATEEEILSEVERLRPWFHCIDLGAGIRTKTESVGSEPPDHPRGTWELIKESLPADLAGKSVLDVGCNAGFYAVEAKRRGASRVMGVDTQRLHVRQAAFVNRVLGLDIDFQRMSVYDLSPRAVGRFDLTLALGLIYHCKHLYLALEKLSQVTSETLILETAILPPEQTPPSFAHSVGGVERLLHALAYVENPPGDKEAVYNWFLPSPASLQAICKNVGFHEVNVFSVREERAVLVCRKREAYADSRDLGQLAGALEIIEAPQAAPRSSAVRYRVNAENTGFAKWLAAAEGPGAGQGAVTLGAHLLRADQEVAAWDYGRAALARDVLPGEVVTLDLHLQAPPAAGTYYVELDMVSEQLAWFEELGAIPVRAKLEVI